MDGLIINSEPLWVRAEIEIFREVGLSLHASDCATTKGLRVDDVVAHWHQRQPWSEKSRAEVEVEIVTRVAELIALEGQAQPGVSHALEVARGSGRSLALASSSPSIVIRAVLKRLGLTESFDAILSAESEAFGKPHPALFLHTARRLNATPAECLVIEDSLTGVIAAKAARMACIAVPEREGLGDPRFSIADVTLGSLEEVTAALLARFASHQ